MVDPRYVYEDLLTMPDDGKRYEILEGDLLVSPSPKPRHQRVVSNLDRLFGHLEAQGLGEGYVAPLDVVLDRHTVVEPDIFFIRTERLGIVTEQNVNGAPDLVVEVLSDRTRDADLGRKLKAYAQHGVPEYWVLDPTANTAQVFRQQDNSLEDFGTFDMDAEIVFLGMTFKVREFFA